MTLYLLLKRAIERKSQTAESLTKKATVFYMADQITETEYNEIIGLISAL